MKIITFLHLICILSLVVGAVTLVLTILNKNINIYRKINTSIYLLALCAYTYATKYWLYYLEYIHMSGDTYNKIFLIILNIISIASIVIAAIEIFSKKDIFKKYFFNIIEFVIFAICVSLTWNLFYSNKQNVYLFPLLIISFILTETFLINSTEKLNNKASKTYYFVTNTIFSCFWLVDLISICRYFEFTSKFILLFLSALIVCFPSIILGILSVKKEYKK